LAGCRFQLRPATSQMIEPMSGRISTMNSHAIFGRLRQSPSGVVITSIRQKIQSPSRTSPNAPSKNSMEAPGGSR